MNIDIHPKTKSVHIWLTQTECDDQAIQALLQPMISRYTALGYTPCLLYSGKQDLTDHTRELVRSIHHQNCMQ